MKFFSYNLFNSCVIFGTLCNSTSWRKNFDTSKFPGSQKLRYKSIQDFRWKTRRENFYLFLHISGSFLFGVRSLHLHFIPRVYELHDTIWNRCTHFSYAKFPVIDFFENDWKSTQNVKPNCYQRRQHAKLCARLSKKSDRNLRNHSKSQQMLFSISARVVFLSLHIIDGERQLDVSSFSWTSRSKHGRWKFSYCAKHLIQLLHLISEGMILLAPNITILVLLAISNKKSKSHLSKIISNVTTSTLKSSLKKKILIFALKKDFVMSAFGFFHIGFASFTKVSHTNYKKVSQISIVFLFRFLNFSAVFQSFCSNFKS